jgi:DHA1 family tetracycline resistance protein-like MFS transporter
MAVRRHHLTLITLLACFACSVEASDISTRPVLASARPDKKLKAPSVPALHTAAKQPAAAWTPPSFYWAVLSNWLYYLSLGMNAVNMAFLVRKIVNEDGSIAPSPAAIALSGKVESADKILTFLGVGLLAALSDVRGRRALMAWSALGFGLTNLIQARTDNSILALYLADVIDGCSSCMSPVCAAYVADCSPNSKRAQNLGIFQGLSVGCAFVLAFPIGGALGAKMGPRVPLYIAAGLQLLNALIILLLTPESHPPTARFSKTVDIREANPLSALRRLFGRRDLLASAAGTYFLISMARNALDAQFVIYANLRFGWTQQQSGPVMVIVGLMLAIAPRLLVPRLGLKNAILSGLLVFAAGLTGAGLAPTPRSFVSSVVVVSVGCMCVPAVQALLTNLAPPTERGAILGAVGSLTELTGAIGSTLYSSILALFTSDQAPLPLPGMHFFVGAAFLLLGFALTSHAFATFGTEMENATSDE